MLYWCLNPHFFLLLSLIYHWFPDLESLLLSHQLNYLSERLDSCLNGLWLSTLLFVMHFVTRFQKICLRLALGKLTGLSVSRGSWRLSSDLSWVRTGEIETVLKPFLIKFEQSFVTSMSRASKTALRLTWLVLGIGFHSRGPNLQYHICLRSGVPLCLPSFSWTSSFSILRIGRFRIANLGSSFARRLLYTHSLYFFWEFYHQVELQPRWRTFNHQTNTRYCGNCLISSLVPTFSI